MNHKINVHFDKSGISAEFRPAIEFLNDLQASIEYVFTIFFLFE